MSWLARFLIRALGRIGGRRPRPRHLALGAQGEAEAYFYLKRLGYKFVDSNYRIPHERGEIDLIGWDKGVLCFVEVKTRTDDSFAPPSTAVTREKQRHIIAVAKRYLRRWPGARPPSCRFDVLSIVAAPKGPQFTLHKGAFTWRAARPFKRRYRDFVDRHLWRGKRS